jgi:alkanesulfonate monooxygenase SsuD/methylene tetrahydromethanopterin reductase-like flavin-dependent oxidoreductase (luciferase family)
LGDAVDAEFEAFGEDANDRVRAVKLDEGLEALVKMWNGERFDYQGRRVTARNAHFLPRSLQTPRIPIWVAGRWPRKAPFRRAARWDGAFPLGLVRGSTLKPDELRKVSDFIKSQRTTAGRYDIIATSGADGHLESEDTLLAYAGVGATWWMRDLWRWCNSRQELMAQVRAGPPQKV